jgi:hypothetical protein
LTGNIGYESQKTNSGTPDRVIWVRISSTVPYPLHNRRKDFYMTKNLLKHTLMVLVLALGTCTAANGLVFKKCGTGKGPPCPTPEVDPSLAISGLTLLAGTLAVLRVRRSNK